MAVIATVSRYVMIQTELRMQDVVILMLVVIHTLMLLPDF